MVIFVLCLADGTHGSTIRPLCAALSGATRQRQPFEPAGLNVILYVAGPGCKWRGLPARFGNWHTIYTRMIRWSKNGVLDRVFEHLQREKIVRIRLDAVSMDSTIVKVHPDETRAQERSATDQPTARRLDHQGSYGCCGCSNRHHLLALAGLGPRRPGRAQAAEPPRPAARR